jgi:hypothetical protein
MRAPDDIQRRLAEIRKRHKLATQQGRTPFALSRV